MVLIATLASDQQSVERSYFGLWLVFFAATSGGVPTPSTSQSALT
jgi:hypothetical protein